MKINGEAISGVFSDNETELIESIVVAEVGKPISIDTDYPLSLVQFETFSYVSGRSSVGSMCCAHLVFPQKLYLLIGTLYIIY